MDVTVPTVSGEDGETDRFVLWAGALLHAPHRAVRQQAKTLHSLVYISARSRGSPAYQFGLMNTMYITHLNGIATPSIFPSVNGLPAFRTHLTLVLKTSTHSFKSR